MAETQQRRKPKKAKIENYYKIIGVRSNATQESIKKNYIQMVKQYPPEQHPEQFQIIRRAYDTLRDPDKRREYDFQRKYGGSLTKIMDEAYEWMEQESWSKAEKLFHQALEISPETVSARLGLLQISVIMERYEQAEQHIQELLDMSKSDEDSIRAHAVITKIWYDSDQPERALKQLELLMERFPDQSAMYTPMLAAIYQDLGRADEAYFMIEARIPAIEEQQPEQFGLFINWINAMINLGKWQYWSRVYPRMKKFLLSIDNEDDRTIIISALLDEYLMYKDAVRFKEAELFVDLALLLDRKNTEVLAFRSEVQLLSRIAKEIEQLPDDRQLHPVIGMQVHCFFMEDFGKEDEFMTFTRSMFNEMYDEITDQEFYAGVNRIKTKYKLLYSRYRLQLEELCVEREER